MSDRSAPAPCPARSPMAAAVRARPSRTRRSHSGILIRHIFSAAGCRSTGRPRRRQSQREIADPTGQSLEAAAASILELASEHMVQAILEVTLSQGIDPASAAFVAGGGAAGLNCVAIGRRLGCRTVYVPETGAALAAAGALISDLTSHHQAMRHTTSESFDFDGVNEVLEQLEARCRAFQESTGRQAEFVAIDWTTEARYPDQAWEIEVPLRRPRFSDPEDVEASRCRFP